MNARLQAAVIGAGPSGFYTAAALLDHGFDVDLLERLPTPFGLVRYGVAPDHPKIKDVARVYEKIATHSRFRFFGGVTIGEAAAHHDLVARYHAVIYAVGAARNKRLGIPGEDVSGCHAAADFVGWYNGHPSRRQDTYDFDCERAVVIGNGNVALDVARMLVLDRPELAVTDTADHAIEALARSSIREVVVVGRRGPAQAAFTAPELRELGDLSRAEILVDSGEGALDPVTTDLLGEAGSATARRNLEVLNGYASRPKAQTSHRIVLRFMLSPTEILAGAGGRVSGVRLARNRLERDRGGTLKAVPTRVDELVSCGLVLRAVGYRGSPVAGVPFDDRRGVIANDHGRIVDGEGRARRGEYVVGWIKRGPTGVIGTNKKDAVETVAQVLDDRAAGRLLAPPMAGRATTALWLAARVPELVGWNGWHNIDRRERAEGDRTGRPRRKLVVLEEMFGAARDAPVSEPRASEQTVSPELSATSDVFRATSA